MTDRQPRRMTSIRRTAFDLAHQSFELYMLALAALTGVTGFLAPSIRSPVNQALPGWAVATWYGGLIVGSVIAAVGILMPRPYGPLVERGGLIVLLGLCLSYACMAAGAAFGVAGVQVAVLVLLFAGALTARIWVIGREPRELKAAITLLAQVSAGGDDVQ